MVRSGQHRPWAQQVLPLTVLTLIVLETPGL